MVVFPSEDVSQERYPARDKGDVDNASQSKAK
jgi:hypothetical protein